MWVFSRGWELLRGRRVGEGTFGLWLIGKMVEEQGVLVEGGGKQWRCLAKRDGWFGGSDMGVERWGLFGYGFRGCGRGGES